MTLHGKRELVLHFVTLLSNSKINPSEKKIGKKSHIHDKHKPAHFRVQTADGRSRFFVVRGKNKRHALSLYCLRCNHGDDRLVLVGNTESSVRKKMAAVHLTTIPCEPNTANMAHRKLCFCEILPRTNNIVHARFQVFKVFL